MIMEQKKPVSIREIVTYIKSEKKLLLAPFLFAMVFALVLYIMAPKEYEVSVRFLPDVPAGESNSILSQLGGAALLGGKTMGNSSGDFIDPSVYAEIVGSTPFLFHFVEGNIRHSEYGDISLREFYRDHKQDDFFTLLKKYTIQLPDRFKKPSSITPEEARDSFEQKGKLQGKDETIINDLKNKFSISYKPELGIVIFSVNFYDAQAAKGLAEEGTKSIIDFLVEYKSQKAIRNLEFVEERYAEAQTTFYKTQTELAEFKDRNLNIWSASAKVKEERLVMEFNRANSVYDNLTQQLELAKLKVQEDTPVFSTIEPPLVPRKPTSPNPLLYLAGALFLGCIVSFSMVYIKLFILETY